MVHAQYKLTYFNAMGRGELIRWILVQSQTEYEDYRLYPETKEWPKIKPDSPFGQLPILEFDGQRYAQSIAIARYLAKEHGLEASTPENEALTDMIVNCCEDIGNGAGPVYFEKDSEKKETLRAKYAEKVDGQMALLEKLLSENNGGDGWMVGDKLTWADLAVTIYTGSWLQPPEVEPDWSKFAKLDALRNKVLSLPCIANWIQKRPVTRL